jgi:uncharacterized damage-inducible protein DinB
LDLLDRLAGHDAWTTHHVLERCREVAPEQLQQHFDIGNGTIYETALHLIRNVEVWTDLMREQPVRVSSTPKDRLATVDELLARFDAAYAEFAALARQITDAGRLDDTYLDVLDDPPARKTFGGTIAHIIIHDMLHRSELLHMLARLGVPDLIEGDVLSWEGLNKRERSG